jgi:hypothetical protein
MNLEEFGPDAKDEMSPADYIKYCMDQYYEYRTLAMDPTINDQATKLYLDKASEYYARAQEAMDEIEPDNTDHLSDEDKALPNVPLDEKDEELSDRDKAMVDYYEEEEANREVPRDYASMYERFEKLAGLKESYTVISPEDYNEGDEVEINTKYYPEHQFPEGTNGIISSVDKADYADDTPVFTVKIKNIDPVFGEQDKLQVEKIRDFK